ncbi:MAG: gliding motility lipoprotein GldH [Sphingobacteriaceae bacterium]
MRLYFSFLLFFAVLGFSACENPDALLDEQLPIANAEWTYIKPVRIKVKIEDNRIPYHVFINLRHTADYKYANIFIRIRQINPDRKLITLRKEFRLANADGEWLGTGSGNLYSYLLPLYAKYRFPAKGTYVFELEQNMRDNPLKEITDVGLRVEKAQ